MKTQMSDVTYTIPFNGIEHDYTIEYLNLDEEKHDYLTGFWWALIDTYHGQRHIVAYATSSEDAHKLAASAKVRANAEQGRFRAISWFANRLYRNENP